MPKVGENLYFMNTSQYSTPYCLGLYLGKDNTGDKVLIPSYISGCLIVNIDSLDPASYRPDGYFNVRDKIYNDNEIIQFDYIFFNQKNEYLVKVKKIDGVWIIIEKPSNMSWN